MGLTIYEQEGGDVAPPLRDGETSRMSKVGINHHGAAPIKARPEPCAFLQPLPRGRCTHSRS